MNKTHPARPTYIGKIWELYILIGWLLVLFVKYNSGSQLNSANKLVALYLRASIVRNKDTRKTKKGSALGVIACLDSRA